MSDQDKPKNPMINLINMGLSGIHDTSDILARLWRLLLYETSIKGHTWITLLSKYQKKLKTTHNEKEISSFKGNLTSTIAKDKISWSTLLRGIVVLGYTSMDIQLTLRKDNKTHILKLTVNDLTKELENDIE